LIFRRGSIGDAIVSIPALNFLRNKYASAEIICLSNSPVMEAASTVKSVLESSGLIDGFIDLPPGGGIASLSHRINLIRGLKCQAAIYLSEPSSRPALAKEMLFFKLCGIPTILGLPFGGTLRSYRPAGENLWESESSRLLRVVAGDGAVAPDWSFQFTDQEQQTAQGLLQGLAGSEGHIAFSIGAKLPDKDWGDANWIQVLGALTGRYPRLGLVSVGAGEDHGRTERVTGAWAGPKVNLCGASEPRISALAMQGAAFYLGHDSGPMHLAALAGTSCIAIFSARAKPGVWFPHGDGHRIFYPWDLAAKVTPRAGFRTAGQSIQSITPPEVIEASIAGVEQKAR
jgi:ADP-heptose:LPS heptosyltransferase